MGAFVLGASCKTGGLRSLISCLQYLNVSLYQRGAFLQDRDGGCCFDDDWACPPVLEADDNLRCMCLERECHALDCGEGHFPAVIAAHDGRTAGQTSGQLCYSSSKVSEHCLSLELWFHSCGVRNYTVGLKRQNPLFGLDSATECSAV